MFNKKDERRNACMLTGKFKKRGYDWWWHSFTAVNNTTGQEVPFFIEYFLCNPALAKETPTLGQLPQNKADRTKPSYLMVKAGCWGKNKVQLHRFFAWKDVNLHGKAPYSVSADDCFASDTKLLGSINISEQDAASHPEWMCDAGSMSWNLELDKQVAFNVGFGASALFRALKAFEMYWHAEGMKTLVSGTITLNGESYTVKKENSYGYADKNWGCGFTSPWVWLSSNDLVSNVSGKRLTNSVFDIGGGRPKVFGIALERKLLSAFWYEGKPYEFNFSKFWTGTKTTFSYEETAEEIVWHVEQQNHHALMRTEMKCKKSDMLWVNYEDPDGNKRFKKLWNGGNGYGNVKLYKRHGKKLELIDDITVGHLGCEYGEFED
ncbi:MAG TPA: hypothetical protein DC014_05875 [Treponema sp.]|nr:hypothetical protein [Treponema sp.]